MKECQLCKTCYTDEVASCPNDGMPTVHTIGGEPVLEGKYHLECRLGQGGMGVVYKARHAYLKTQLAIKVILPDLVGNDPQLVTRFRQEALAAAAIRHQNVVSVTDYGVIEGTVPFLVMEYVEGESLHDLLAREKKLSPERAYELMSAICAGVGAAHHQGIVHRDLKPLNIMICNDKPNLSQAVKILDFGLAKIKSGELLGSFVQAQTTGLMGSPYYMAPEQWADEDPDSRADVYSLGVMLFQMLSGDVPFKGSSIPAIMKKHISDPPPTFASVGLDVAPELEQAVHHALAKSSKERTPSVDALVNELRAAIQIDDPFIHTGSTQRALPVSSLKITSRPPRASVFVDNVAVGQTTDTGQLMLEGIQSGNHHLRVSHQGFQDWTADVVCDGKPQEVFADLTQGTPGAQTVPGIASAAATMPIVGRDLDPNRTVIHDGSISRFDASVPAITAEQKHRLMPWLLGTGGVLALLVIGAIGLGAAYVMGVFGGKTGANTQTVSTSTEPTPATAFKPELVAIPGGSFRMGNNEGRENERPEHQATVQPFRMDKFEITNAEYYSFVSETGYRPVPAHWVNDRPVSGTEKMPIRFVNVDDANAFARWRSKRDGVTYRLPTETEWEYAARGGANNYRYPWGNSFDPKCAVTDKENTEPDAVGTGSCGNEWGVMDLIGNVFEWTSSPPSLYPGSKGQIRPSVEPKFMIRGGAAFTKSSGEFAITATFRQDVNGSTRDKELGFRLVTDGQ